MTPGEFAAIEARVAAATPGPWLVKGMYPQEVLGNDDGLTLVATTHSSPDGPPSNTEFIAHSREDIPALLAAVRERDNTIARVREVLDDYDGLDPEPIPKLSTHTWMHEIRAALDPRETR